MNTSEIISKTGVVILSAGQGTRLGCQNDPKVMLEIGGKPIVSYIVDTLKKVGFKDSKICLVVGFQKERVIDYFAGKVIYAYQEEQLGTAHAAYTGMKVLPPSAENVLVLNGDDSAFYRPSTIVNLMEKHIENGSAGTVLSTEIDPDDFGYGRVLRKEDGGVELIEKEYLTENTKNINETSTGTFCFKRNWYTAMFPNMPKLDRLGEYGLPSAFTMAQKEGLSVQVVKLNDPREWFGINTPEELSEADDRKSIGKF